MMFWPPNQSGLAPLKRTAVLNPDTLSESTAPNFRFDYIDIGSVTYGKGITEKQSMLFADAPSRARKPVKENDLIISTVRTYLRAIARIGVEDDGNIVSTGFVVCRSRPETVPDFLYYAVHSQPFIEQIVALSTGISYPAINPSILGGIKLPLPPLEEQTAIANFLDCETTRIDGLIEKKGRFIELLKEKRAALITHAVTKGIDADVPMEDSGVERTGGNRRRVEGGGGRDCEDAGRGDGMTALSAPSQKKATDLAWAPEIPYDWEIKRGKFLFDLQKRQVCDEDDIVTAFRDGQVTLRKMRRTDGFTNALKEAGYQRVHKGDLVIHAMDAFAGAVGVSDSDGKCTPAYSCCTPKNGVSAEFYARLIWTMALSGFIESLAKGIRERSTDFRWREFAEQSLPVPPYEQQLEINAFLDRETTRIDGLVAKTKHSIELLKEKRSALITAAVTGKIDVRNAT